MKESSDLLPCPFCGGEAYFDWKYHHDAVGNFVVKCRHCCITTDEYASSEEAYIAWCTRGGKFGNTQVSIVVDEYDHSHVIIPNKE